jgi:acetyl-CoA carboxylase biotin carboxylase subunit
MFKKILIANRGEIAVRVIRACREMGLRSVAIFSDVDRAALHVRMADEAYPLLPPEEKDRTSSAAATYLNIPRILEIARGSGAQAIHPGYGFLSENARFAEACEQAGVKFIGPNAAAMRLMGSKTAARAAMQRAGVPFVPGSSSGLQSIDEARRLAEQLGYPVMLKAAAGGGGKGMRLVRSQSELASALEAARSEAQRAFGDDEVYVEKLIERPRHVEIQVLADELGHTVYLGERECSIQRRHQKVIEESPSPIVDDEMRRRMGEVAVRAAEAAGYTNAGTVEFLVDRDRNFYFLEMNTRLQVEHPVTELVTGLDLVQLQIRIAAGEPLPFRQQDIRRRGHAIECRIYAEDPENNFFPSPGRIARLVTPSGPGIREDSGVFEGWEVPLDYDPLLSKLIAYGESRYHAITRLQRALSEYFIGGIKSNLPLFRRILHDEDFLAGELDTSYLDRLLAKSPSLDDSAAQKHAQKDERHIAAIAAVLFVALGSGKPASNGNAGNTEPAPEKRDPHAGTSGNGTRASHWKRVAREEGLR